MQDKSQYKKYVHQTIEVLEEFDNQLFSKILNLAMFGEMNDVDDQFSIGETVSFKLEDFAKLDDENIQSLIKIILEVNKLKNTMENLYPDSGD